MHTKIIRNVDYNVDIKTLKCIKHNFKKKKHWVLVKTQLK